MRSSSAGSGPCVRVAVGAGEVEEVVIDVEVRPRVSILTGAVRAYDDPKCLDL